MATQLVVARPGKFDGVELVGGSHIDAVPSAMAVGILRKALR
jgi:hypothetical protein